jgi:hypothetical protein
MNIYDIYIEIKFQNIIQVGIMGHWFITLKDKIISRKGYNKFVKQLEALSILEVYNVLLSPGKKESCMTFYIVFNYTN